MSRSQTLSKRVRSTALTAGPSGTAFAASASSRAARQRGQGPCHPSLGAGALPPVTRLGALASLNDLPEVRRHQVANWRVRRAVLMGGPSIFVVETHNFRRPRALRSVLAFADGRGWVRRLQLYLDTGELLVVQHGRGWLQPLASSDA